MDGSSRQRMLRNLVFGVILVALTLVLGVRRLGPLFSTPEPESPLEDASGVELPPPPPLPPAAPELADLSFLEFGEQYEALRDSFRARDELIHRVEGRRVVWEGYLRNVSKQPNAFYVSVGPSEGYRLSSALVTFDHSFEDHLYALHPEDHVRFEGVVTRAGGSLGIDGTAIERIE